jgi:hypothetical protein
LYSSKSREEIVVHAKSFLESAFVVDLVKEHKEWLKDAFATKLEYTDFTEGILGKDNVEKNPHLFLAYQLFLAKRLGTIRASEEKIELKRRRATFKIIPQLTMATRCVTFGLEPTTELLHYLAKNNKVGDFVKEDQVLSKVDLEDKELEYLEETTKVLQRTLDRAEQNLLECNYDVKQETLKRKVADKCRAKLCSKQKI